MSKELQKRRQQQINNGINGDEDFREIRAQRRKVLEKALEAQKAAKEDIETSDEPSEELTEGLEPSTGANNGREAFELSPDGMTNEQIALILEGAGVETKSSWNKAELLEAWAEKGTITVGAVSNEGLAGFIETHDVDLPDDADRETLLEYFED